MRQFRYRLRAALRRAEHQEHVCKMELARREVHLREARGWVERLGEARRELHRRLRWLQDGNVKVVRLAGLSRDLDRLGDLMADARSLCAELEEGVAEERSRLTEMARERKKLETHRDGLMAQHRRAEMSAEGKQLDDLAMTRFAAPGPMDARTS